MAAHMNTAKKWQKEKMEEAVGLWEGKKGKSGAGGERRVESGELVSGAW